MDAWARAGQGQRGQRTLRDPGRKTPQALACRYPFEGELGQGGTQALAIGYPTAQPIDER